MSSATVAFASLRTDLANLPGSISSMLFNSNTPAQNVVLELSFPKGLRGQGRIYLGWSGLSSSSAGTIEVDPAFAHNVGLAHGQKVSIKLHANPPVAHTVHLEPETIADWEIVESHAAFLESWMINQVRAVSLAHPITVYPSPTSIACLQVTKIEPAPTGPFAKLSPDSEVIVAPKVRHTAAPVSTGSQKEQKQAEPKQLRPIVLRSAAYPFAGAEASVTPRLYANIPAFSGQRYVSVAVVASPMLQDTSEKEDEVVPSKSVVAELLPPRSDDGAPSMSYGLSSALRVPGSVNTLLQISAAPEQSSGTIVVHPYTIGSGPQSIKMGGAEQSIALDLEFAGNGWVLPPSKDLPVGGIVSASFPFGKIDKIDVGKELALAESKVLPTPEQLVAEPVRPVVGREKLLGEINDAALAGAGTLVYGSRGAGKSVLIAAACRRLKKQLVRPVYFNAGNYMDKSVPAIKDALRKKLLEAAWYAPSVLVLDDLDKLIPAELEHADSSKTAQIAEIFCSLAAETTAARAVALLATCQAKETLHSSLISSHVFEELLCLRSPDKDVREAVLQAGMDSLGLKGVPGFDVLDVAGNTEGYQPGDIWTLCERVAANQLIDGTNTDVTVGMFEKATSEYTPASLRGVKLEKGSATWSEIGGLKDVKRVILETLEWPTKYAPIFANCPLRLRSGLLLYGYPGCGKTLIASAVAAECGLNFISVKGPEILNKYIGASEQSVRDLFDRAQAAKPCVLFFDEFDSIAPKRGHDSTGVTDRVVNQMLTQMDGAEGLDGVYVLAATSRPDLIDSALLRPGRLDKSLLCDMPSQQDRVDIMEAAKSKMTLADDVDLNEIAAQTAGYSGADLQALMYNAYLDAIHEVIDTHGDQLPNDSAKTIELFQIGGTHSADSVRQFFSDTDSSTKNHVNSANSSNSAADHKQNQVIVHATHLAKSLQDTKPSISTKELAKLRGIYQSFVSDRDGQMPPGTSSTDIGGRVTLS